MKTNRRHFLAGLSAIAPLSSFSLKVFAEAATPDYFANLGVCPFINAIGPYSSLGGAEMWPEVIDAMDYAIKNKARMSDLHDAVGRRIAELTGAEGYPKFSQLLRTQDTRYPPASAARFGSLSIGHPP